MNIQPQPSHTSSDNQPMGFHPRGFIPTPGARLPDSYSNYPQMILQQQQEAPQPPIILITPPNSDYLIHPHDDSLSASRLNPNQPVSSPTVLSPTVSLPVTAVTSIGSLTFLTPPELKHKIDDRAAYLFRTPCLNQTQSGQTTDLNDDFEINWYCPPVPTEIKKRE